MRSPTSTPTPLAETAAAERLGRASALLAEREPHFRRTARRFSACSEDGEDSYQRAVEILLTKAPKAPPPQLAAWMQVVTRHEALAVGRERRRLIGPTAVAATPEPTRHGAAFDPDEFASPDPEPADLLEVRERACEAARRLAALKPQERRAIGLQAAGCSYAEIQAITGWTYTKVNRCLAEGRAALRRLEPSAPSTAAA